MRKQPSNTTVRGRCIRLSERSPGVLQRISIQNPDGIHELEVNDIGGVLPGDLVEIQRGIPRVLTPNRASNRSTEWMNRVLDPRRVRATQIRSQVEDAIREFFRSQGFHEVRTPLLVPSPGMEIHIRPFKLTTGAYLPTSPEFAMKRLLSGGLEKIFQLAPAFRLEPNSTTHHPEFLMLEWYRAYADDEAIMRDTEELFRHIATRVHGSESTHFQGQEISFKGPWPRLGVRQLFLEMTGVDLVRCANREKLAEECIRLGIKPSAEDTWDDLYFRIWLNLIEPKLPVNQACIVKRYPASQSALAVIDEDPDGSRWARRFEVYAAGLELGNAFQELTDPVEQRRRFIQDMEERQKIYGSSFPPSPIDESFLSALEEGMPPSAGIAMGVDRIVMLMADEPEIEKTLWLQSYSGIAETT